MLIFPVQIPTQPQSTLSYAAFASQRVVVSLMRKLSLSKMSF